MTTTSFGVVGFDPLLMFNLIFGAALLGVGVPAVDGLFPVRLIPGVEPPPILSLIIGFDIVVDGVAVLL